jgi:ethanolamine transporter EutH|tara:strand:- start:116 stop:307 length:192 start_codon:yes stop_codon:yes gene_type:complete
MKEKSSTLLITAVIFFIIYIPLFALMRDLGQRGRILAVAIAFFSAKPLAKQFKKNSSSNNNQE